MRTLLAWPPPGLPLAAVGLVEGLSNLTSRHRGPRPTCHNIDLLSIHTQADQFDVGTERQYDTVPVLCESDGVLDSFLRCEALPDFLQLAQAFYARYSGRRQRFGIEEGTDRVNLPGFFESEKPGEDTFTRAAADHPFGQRLMKDFVPGCPADTHLQRQVDFVNPLPAALRHDSLHRAGGAIQVVPFIPELTQPALPAPSLGSLKHS